MKQFLELVNALSRATWRWLKDLPLWIKYAALVVLVAALGGLLIWKWGFRKQIDTGLIGRSAENDIENLWFLRDGTLVGTSTDSEGFQVLLWPQSDPNRIPEHSSFPVYDLFYFLRTYVRGASPTETAARAGLGGNSAVMRDGDKMVINYQGLLAAFRNDLPSLDDYQERGDPDSSWRSLVGNLAEIVDLGPNQANSPAALTFTDNGLLALAYHDGRVEFRNSDNIRQIVGERGTNLTNPTLMKPLGDYLAVVSVPKAVVVVLDVSSVKDTPFHGYPPGADPLIAISEQGRLAVSKGSDEVFLTKPDGTGDTDIMVRAYGNVRTLSFFDDERVIVGGHFQDVYLVAENQLPYKIAVAPKGVNALAVSSNRLAYAGQDGLAVYWHSQRRVLNRIGWATITVFGLFFLALAALYVYDYKKRQEEAEAAIPPISLPTKEEVPRLGVPEVPAELVKAFRDGECVLYCGSGVSAQAGFPYWQPFVQDLTEWTINSGFVAPKLGASLKAALVQGQYDSVSDNLVSIMRDRQPQLNEYLRGIFLNKATLPESVKLLKGLPFSAAMTTNFDNLLEQAFSDKSTTSLTPADADLLLQCLHKREFFLLKLYGKLEKPETVMLAPSQYDDVVTGNLVFSSFMETLLVSRTVFFVGASLEGIQAYLKGMPLRRQSRRTHYALVPVTGDAWQAKANPLRERYGIEVLPYSPSDGHPELLEFLQNLDTEIEKSEGAAESVDRRTVLKKISVTDIGPFENLELKFDPHWNILLGDNGVGKSSIIKAIAIAIVGEDAKSYAQRIIKAGKTNSVITLESGRNTYTTRLFRNNGAAKVESVPGRAFEAEGWLAVAFPPLRTMSWARPTSVETGTTGRERPTTDDLLPVILGEADPRLDNLKKWIVNVDYRIKDAKFRKQDPTPHEKLLNDFFQVVTQLTTGTKIEFKGVNADTKEITVVTDDGELPIEALSQGMTSLIGWVGILLQRLYEVYGKDDTDPKEHYALVLMDEIDAHLHPAWQQSLIQRLSKIFPNVQFIATTHSPLIVGGMNPEQIIRFARDEDDKVVTYTVTEEMTTGRADQILSSDLFGLGSTMKLNVELQQLMDEYHDLLGYDERSEEDQHRFRELREILKERIPPVAETPAEQKAMRLVRALVETDGDGEYARENQFIVDRAEALLTEVSKKRK